jgi:multidrug efflux pump subunit AcrA (membrane-fusion protein)
VKIDRLHLSGFRSHIDTNLEELDQLNIFVGANGSGKSSILDAIAFALTGTCRGTDQGGRGADQLATTIPGYANPGKFSVAMQFLGSEGGGNHDRDPWQLSRSLGQGPKSQAQQIASQLVGFDIAFTRAMVFPGQFLDLPEREQRDIVLSLSETDNLQELLLGAAGNYSSYLPPIKVNSREDIALIHKALRDHRPEVKAAIKAIAFPDPPKSDFRQGVAIATAKADAENAQAALDAATVGIKTIEAKELELRERIGKGEKIILDFANQMDEIPSDVYTQINDTKRQLSLAEGQEVKQLDGRAELSESAQELQSTEAGYFLAFRLLEELAAKKKTKPKCGCLNAVKSAYTKAGKERAAANRELEEHVEEKEDDVASNLRKKVADLEKQHAEKLRIEGCVRGAQDRIADLDKELEDLARKKKTARVGPKAMKKLEAAVSEANEKWIEEKAREKQAGDYRKALGVAQDREKALKLELGAVEALIEATAPTGELLAGISGEAASGLAETISQLVGPDKNASAPGLLPDLYLSTEPWGIYLHGRDIKLASESERWRANLVIALALALDTGFGIACIDGADILADEPKQELMALARLANIDQIFMCSTVPADRIKALQKAKAYPGTAYWHVTKENGVSSVQRIGA